MGAGPDKALSRVVQVFGAARLHHAYLFANQHGTRMKVLVYRDANLAALQSQLQTLSPEQADAQDKAPRPSHAVPRCPHACRACRSPTSPRTPSAVVAAR